MDSTHGLINVLNRNNPIVNVNAVTIKMNTFKKSFI